jgi:hypothetical protein
MTKEELHEQLNEIYRQEKAERENYFKNGGIAILDGPISAKYRKMRKELFEQYEEEKSQINRSASTDIRQ